MELDPVDTRPVYLRCADALRERILRDMAPGAAFPSETSLSRQLGVSGKTVNIAVTLLVSEGLLERKNLRRTIVSPQLRPGDGTSVVLALRRTGHLFADTFQGLVNHLGEELGIEPSLARPLIEAEPLPPRGGGGRQHRLLIAEGNMYADTAVLAERQVGFDQTIWFCGDAMAESLPGARILSDIHTAGERIAEHLLQEGHRRVLYVRNPLHMAPEVEAVSMYRGLCAKWDAAGLDARTTIALRETDDVTENASALPIGTEGGFTAVVVRDDYRAMRIALALREQGLRPMRDYVLCGAGHTPWSQLPEIPMHTVDFHLDRAVRSTVDLVRGYLNGQDIEGCCEHIAGELVLYQGGRNREGEIPYIAEADRRRN